MGCSFRVVKGRRIRTGPVGAPVSAGLALSLSLGNLLSLLNLPSVAGSASFTAEELSGAVVRIYQNPETGYFLEARFTEDGPPMVRPISQAEATAWEAQTPTPAQIAHAFTPYEIPSY